MTRTRRPSVKLVHGKVTTTSLKVAEFFGKRHDNVIRAIQKLECPQNFTALNFEASEYTDSTGRKLPMYLITRDGFALLAMGFTGKEAMQWKIAYLEAFNKLEAAALEKLKARKTLPRSQRALPNPVGTVSTQNDAFTSAFMPPDGKYVVRLIGGKVVSSSPVAEDAYVVTDEKIAAVIADPSYMFEKRYIPAVIAACARRLG